MKKGRQGFSLQDVRQQNFFDLYKLNSYVMNVVRRVWMPCNLLCSHVTPSNSDMVLVRGTGIPDVFAYTFAIASIKNSRMRRYIMRPIILLLLLFAATATFAQPPAIHFLDIDYETALQQAKEEGKPLFLYIGQKGCGPCIQMEQTVFSQPAVAHYINNKFVALSAYSDSETGQRFVKRKNHIGYPLCVVLDGNGDVQHQFAGVFSIDAFMYQAKVSCCSKNNLKYCKDQYRDGNRDPEFLRRYITRLEDAGELTDIEINAYLDTQEYRNLMKQENLVFIYEYALYNLKPSFDIDSDAYRFLIRNRELFAQFYDRDQVEVRIVMTAYTTALRAAEQRDSDVFHRSLEILRSFDKSHSYQLEDSDGNVMASLNGQNLVHTAEIKYYGKELVANR